MPVTVDSPGDNAAATEMPPWMMSSTPTETNSAMRATTARSFARVSGYKIVDLDISGHQMDVSEHIQLDELESEIQDGIHIEDRDENEGSS